MEDNLQWKTTSGGRQPSVEDNPWWKTNFGDFHRKECTYQEGGICSVHGGGARLRWKPVGKKKKGEGFSKTGKKLKQMTLPFKKADQDSTQGGMMKRDTTDRE